ncbi:DUF6855 family protein [Propioniciclava tarda]|uniref:DUF6855 family protein n=1 Tax=Propioniciclava tarda TaxID=433330 RepID=UPI003CC82C1F
MPVGSTKLSYQARAIDDLHAWLVAQGDWVPLGAADENKPAAPGTVEAFGRDEANPVGVSTGSARLPRTARHVPAPAAGAAGGWSSSPTRRATTACGPSAASDRV